MAVIAVLELRAKGKVYVFKMPTYATAVLAVLANFAGISTLFFQIVFSLESARSNNSMSVGACAVVDIGV